MMTSEERIRSQDLGKCYRVLSEENARKLGEKFEGEAEAFTSQNTHCLDVDGIVKNFWDLLIFRGNLTLLPLNFPDKEHISDIKNARMFPYFKKTSGNCFYSTVTLFARFRGLSTSKPFATET